MHKNAGLVVMLGSVMLFAGCISAPFVPPMGGAYSDVSAPLSVDQNRTAVASKKGEASTQCILGLVSWGDVSTKTAAQNGGLKTINHLDYGYFNVLGVYQKTTVTAFGE